VNPGFHFVEVVFFCVQVHKCQLHNRKIISTSTNSKPLIKSKTKIQTPTTPVYSYQANDTMVLADTISVLQYLFTFLILAMAFAYVTPKLVLAYRLIALTCQGIRRKTKFPSITREKQGTWPEPQSREELFRTLCSLSSSSCSISTMQEDLSTTSTENSSSDSSNRTATMIQTGTTRTYDTNNHKKKDTTKVIWGYWHQGINNLPGFCQMAVESWRLHHPDWNVIILSQENYKDFVRASNSRTDRKKCSISCSTCFKMKIFCGSLLSPCLLPSPFMFAGVSKGLAFYLQVAEDPVSK